MKTNNGKPGTSIPQFKSGMVTYCTRKGRNIDFISCFNNGYFSFGFAMENLNSGHPLAIFTNKYAVALINQFDESDNLDILVGKLSHTMVGFGYRQITYRFSNGTERTDSYLEVATGLKERRNGYFNVNSKTLIDEVFAINIY